MTILAESYTIKCESCGEPIHHEKDAFMYPGSDMDDTVFCMGCKDAAIEYGKAEAEKALPGLIYARWHLYNQRNRCDIGDALFLLDARIELLKGESHETIR